MIRQRIGTLFVLLFFLAVLTGGIIYDDLSASGDDPYQAIKLLNETIHQVSDKYVDPIGSDSLYLRALDGMLMSLDQYSQLLTPDDYDDLRIHTQGNYEGLGIQIDIVDQVLTVVAPIEGTPAYRAGLRAGDQILAVDGESTRGWTEDTAVKELRGPGGSHVVLSIGRQGLDETTDVEIVRSPITLSSVPYAFLLPNSIGYVRFRQFSERGREEVRKAVRELEREGMRGLILDLRGNPGGLLDQAIEVSDLFLPKGVEIVATRGRMADSDRTYTARDNDDFSVHPMVVLVDRASASASEIVAGALQDHDRALVVGQSTWGKGLVQSLFPMDDGYFLKLTTARYYTPSGRSIQRDEANGFDEMAIVDDFGTLDDPRAEFPDSLIFKTDMGRTVYGGGGVMPDVLVKNDKFSDLSRELVREMAIKNAFFSYAVQYRAENGGVSPRFLPSEAVVDDYRAFLRNVKEIEFDDAAFEVERDYIRDFLRYTLISHEHGEGAARQAVMRADVALSRGVDLLTEADTLADLFRIADRDRRSARAESETTRTVAADAATEAY